MARPRKPIEAPPRRNFLRDGGDVPADNPAECERLAAMLPRIADPEAFRRDVLGASTWLNLGLFEKTFSDPKAVYGELGELCKRLESVLVALTDLGY